jgi:hypothetical protein
MRTYVSALCWAAAILLLAVVARFGWVEREAAGLLLLVLPMIAFVTLLGGRDCRCPAREA